MLPALLLPQTCEARHRPELERLRALLASNLDGFKETLLRLFSDCGVYGQLDTRVVSTGEQVASGTRGWLAYVYCLVVAGGLSLLHPGRRQSFV